MLKLPVKPPIVNENIDLSEYAKKSDVDAIGTSLGNKAEKKDVEELNSQLDTLNKKVDDEIKEIQSTTDTFKENINTSFNEFSNEQQNNFEALREEVLSDIEASYVGYDNEQHHNLESRLYSDFDKINQRFNDNSYLEYEGTSIKADNTYYGLTKDLSVKGRTLQNLLEFKNINNSSLINSSKEIVVNGSNGASASCNFGETPLLKPNTEYTIFVNIKKSTNYSSDKFVQLTFGNKVIQIYLGEGVKKVKFTTPSEITSYNAIFYFWGDYQVNEGSLTIGDFMLFEGDYTSTPIEELPFIEGIESTGDKSKNLCDNIWESGRYTLSNGEPYKDDSAIRTVNFINCKPSTTYTITTFNGDRIYNFNEYNNGVFIKATQGNDQTTRTITTSATTNQINFSMSRWTENTVIQFEEGEQATPYQEYYEGYKISGKSCGKNLFDGEWEIGGLNWSDGNKNTNTDRTRTVNYINCKGNTVYAFDGVTLNGRGIGIFEYDSNYKFVNSYQLAVGHNPNTRRIATKINTCYIKIMLADSVDFDDKFIFEETTTPTPYEPYQESTYSYILDRPLMQLPNGVADSIDLETGVLTRRVGKVVLDGENYNPYTKDTNHSGVKRWCIYTNSNVKNTDHTKVTCICDKYPSLTARETYGSYAYPLEGVSQNNSNNMLFLFLEKYKDGSAESKSLLVNELKENPITVYYELNIPTTEQLTPTQLKSFEGTTHITSNNTLQAHTSVKIHSYVQAVVTNLINENEALRSNVDILNVENEGLKETNEVQDELIDINMMATDEVYTMIEPLLASQPQIMSVERGASKLVDMYVAMVQRGLKTTIDQVPIRYRAEVQAILEALEK